jgi:Kef-type K+ transport system membrane component KefB
VKQKIILQPSSKYHGKLKFPERKGPPAPRNNKLKHAAKPFTKFGTMKNSRFKRSRAQLESRAHPMHATPVLIVKKPTSFHGTNNNVEDAVTVQEIATTTSGGSTTTNQHINDLVKKISNGEKHSSAIIIAKALSQREEKTSPIAAQALNDLVAAESSKNFFGQGKASLSDALSTSSSTVQDASLKRHYIPATPVTPAFKYIPSLIKELQFIDFKPISTTSKKYLGIGHSMRARFVWTPTLWDLTNSTGGKLDNGPKEGPRLPMIYLDEAPCRLRQTADPFYRCLVLKKCRIGQYNVRDSLSIGFDGIFSVHHTVVEDEGDDKSNGESKMAALKPSADEGRGKELDFECIFVEHRQKGSSPGHFEKSENFTFTKQSPYAIISKRPISSTAQVIKPTTIRTAIVATMITVEAVLDQPGLRIVQGNCAINDEPVVSAFDLGRGLYTLEYEVKEGNTDRPLGKLPFRCEFQDKAGNNCTVGPMDLQSWFSVNANPPKFKHVSIVNGKTIGTVHAGDQVIVEMLTERKGLRLIMEKCLVNGIDVTASQNITNNGYITVKLNISTGQSDWFAGQLSIDCWIKDKDGNAARITKFTDNNTLAGDAHTPGLRDYIPNLVLATGFAVVSVASGQIATMFPKVGFPLITGYLLTGILAGPEILNLIPEKSIRTLRFVDEISLAVIAISAGAKIYLPKMKGRWKSIGYVLGFLLIVEYIVGAGTIFALHNYIKLMAGTLVCARSPASAVAIVREMKAEGPWTQTVLGVTVLSDVSVIALFALTSLFSGSLLANRQHSNSVILIFAAQIILSSFFGWVFGIVLVTILSVPFDRCDKINKQKNDMNGKQKNETKDGYVITPIKRIGTILKCISVISMGFTMFVLGHMFDPYMQPLITCMVGGFIVANYSNQRKELHRVLDQMSNGVMVAFFTLAGAALDLQSLSETIMISTALFLGRIGAIIIGSWLGGWMAGDPSKFNRAYSLGFVTQAGVTLGLAKKIHLENRVWGGGFATVIIACVVLNQLVGPVLLRWALTHVNEAGKQGFDSVFGGGGGSSSSSSSGYAVNGGGSRQQSISDSSGKGKPHINDEETSNLLKNKK